MRPFRIHLRRAWLFFCLGALLSGGCASIMRRSASPCLVSSVPAGARVTVRHADGSILAEGVTPVAFTLRADAGYLSPARYRLDFCKAGYEPGTTILHATCSRWTAGNLLLPGSIFWVFGVDAVSGKMFRMPDALTHALEPAPPSGRPHAGAPTDETGR